MLVFNRSRCERVVIRHRRTGEQLTIIVSKISKGRARLAFDAAEEDYEILRAELLEAPAERRPTIDPPRPPQPDRPFPSPPIAADAPAPPANQPDAQAREPVTHQAANHRGHPLFAHVAAATAALPRP